MAPGIGVSKGLKGRNPFVLIVVRCHLHNGIALCVVATWSLYGGDVEVCHGVVVVSEVGWDEGPGAHHDKRWTTTMSLFSSHRRQRRCGRWAVVARLCSQIVVVVIRVVVVMVDARRASSPCVGGGHPWPVVVRGLWYWWWVAA